jgi:hypothetical protein
VQAAAAARRGPQPRTLGTHGASVAPCCHAAPQLTSDLQNLRQDMHEIDFEFINGDPAPVPGSLWTNMFVEGKTSRETLIPPRDIQAVTGNKNFQTYSDFHVYTLDWQPGYVRWFVGERAGARRPSRDAPDTPPAGRV